MEDFVFTLVSRTYHMTIRILGRIERKNFLIRFRSVGKNLIFTPLGSHFSAETIRIGDNVFIGELAWFGGDITIGNNVMFGPRPMILAGNHIFGVLGKSPRFIRPAYPGQNYAPVLIEDEVWIGANVVILGDVTVGIGSVIGAGSVVSKDVYTFTISVGNPCRPLRQILDDDHLFQHLVKIVYTEDFALSVVDRRKKCLEGVDIPAIDKTGDYSTLIYDAAV